MIRGTSSGALCVIGIARCMVYGHLRESTWMSDSNYSVNLLFAIFSDGMSYCIYRINISVI